jgi:rSAM/selenodomain-associated transferase 2
LNSLSIIIPVLNEATQMRDCLEVLAPLRARGHEIIVVDGGSADGTRAVAAALADAVLCAPRGRSVQMNAGAAAARGQVLLFLHADTRLPRDADTLIADALAADSHAWGRFDVQIDGASPLLALVARMMNLRSRLSGIATGDQAMFVRAVAFRSLGGFPALPLMEDIAMSRLLKRLSAPACLRQRVTTSGRRWEKGGVLRTIGLMWWLRLRFFFGADAARLARAYRERR